MSDATGPAGHQGKPAPAVVRKGAAGRAGGVVCSMCGAPCAPRFGGWWCFTDGWEISPPPSRARPTERPTPTIHRERPPREGERLNGARVLRVSRWGRCRYEAELDNGRRVVVLTGRPPQVAPPPVAILEDPYA